MRAIIFFRKPAPGLLLAFALALAVPAEGKNVLFASTPKVVVDTMLMMGEVDASDNLVDLGSGDGRIPIIAAKEFHANAVGIEYDPDLIARSRENAVRKRIVLKAERSREQLRAAFEGNRPVVSQGYFEAKAGLADRQVMRDPTSRSASGS